MHTLSPHSLRLLRIIGIILLGIVVTGVVGYATIHILSSISPRKLGGSSNAVQTMALSAPDVIKKYKDDPKLSKALSSSAYKIQEGVPTDSGSAVLYQADKQAYAVMVPTHNTLTYTAASVGLSTDAKSVQAFTESFMTGNSLQNVSTPSQGLSKGQTLTTYANSQTVCQLDNNVPPAASGLHAYHRVSCVAKSAMTEEYGALQKLLSLSAATSQVNTHVVLVTRSTTTEGTKSFSIVSKTDTTSTSTEQLFAAINGNWEYIGDLTTDTSNSKGTKYNLSAALKAAVNNPKYGGFLAKYIH